MRRLIKTPTRSRARRRQKDLAMNTKCKKKKDGKETPAILGAMGAVVAGLTGAFTTIFNDDDDGQRAPQGGGTRWEATISGFYDKRSSDELVVLDETWSFATGDDMSFAERDFDDSAWDEMKAGEAWEENGYEEYDGFAWYRQSFNWSGGAEGRALHLRLGRIDDVDEVFLNGVKIGATGLMPPEVDTAWDTHRVYRVPEALLRQGEDNVLAIRVYDLKGIGGLQNTELTLYALNLPAPLVDLMGWWELSRVDDPTFPENIGNAEGFEPMIVPGYWDRQGMRDFNGHAWYRKHFDLAPTNENLLLMLGKIDDCDEVYLNGQLIGETGDDDPNTEDWRKRRAYEFAGSLLKPEGNILAVRVLDERISGGIFLGPVGIMTVADHADYWREFRANRNQTLGWSGLWNWMLGRD